MKKLIELTYNGTTDETKRVLIPTGSFFLVEGGDKDAMLIEKHTGKAVLNVYFDQSYTEIKELIELSE